MAGWIQSVSQRVFMVRSSMVSIVDCIFMLLAAVRRAKRNGHVISVALSDIAKAYVSVDRELLYRKLDSIGFGGRIKSWVQSMYFNDCVCVRIKGGLSAPLWFTKGVKQGCVLSPLLFALYISGLGRILHSWGSAVWGLLHLCTLLCRRFDPHFKDSAVGYGVNVQGSAVLLCHEHETRH